MSLLTRRRLLVSVVPAVGGGVAGCTGLGAVQRSAPTIEHLEAQSENPEPHTVSVLLLADGEPLFAETVDLPPYNPETNRIRTQIFEGYPTDEPVETLYAWRDDQPRDDWQEADLTRTDNECEDIIVRIRNENVVSGEPLTLRHALAGCEGP